MPAPIRNLPVPITDVARIAPGQPVGEDRRPYRQAPHLPAGEPHNADAATTAPAVAGEPRPGHLPRLPYPVRSDAGAGTDHWPPDHPPPGRSFTRALLTSASFGAQQLGQSPPYENEALLRVAATVAYRRASDLSVDYLGAFQPVDVRI